MIVFNIVVHFFLCLKDERKGERMETAKRLEKIIDELTAVECILSDKRAKCNSGSKEEVDLDIELSRIHSALAVLMHKQCCICHRFDAITKRGKAYYCAGCRKANTDSESDRQYKLSGRQKKPDDYRASQPRAPGGWCNNKER